jgi:hypothetical protein
MPFSNWRPKLGRSGLKPTSLATQFWKLWTAGSVGQSEGETDGNGAQPRLVDVPRERVAGGLLDFMVFD